MKSLFFFLAYLVMFSVFIDTAAIALSWLLNTSLIEGKITALASVCAFLLLLAMAQNNSNHDS